MKILPISFRLSPGMLLGLFFLYLFSGFCTSAWPEQTEIKSLSWTTEGSAEISSGNLAQAQALALENAFKSAITQALTQALGEKTVKEKGKLIENTFFKDPVKFINRYKILSQTTEDALYKIQVEVELSKSQMNVGLTQAGLSSTKSKILILTIIENESGFLKSSWLTSAKSESLAQKILTLELQSWGYRLANPEPIFEPEKLDKNISDPNWLSQLKNKYDAEVFILGKLNLKTELKTKAEMAKGDIQNIDAEEASEDLYSAKSELELTIIDLINQEQNRNLKAEEATTSPGAEKAREECIKQVVHSILPELSLALSRMEQMGLGSKTAFSAVIEVTGITSYEQYQRVFEELKKLSPIQEIRLWGFAPATVKLQLSFSGDKESLKKAISSTHFSEFRLLPIESAPKDLRFKFEPL